ncbi:hypothetical protein HY572_06095 [Candidatus Micrarchaeota archaeon]|nr:hypothetical protein [Candidatus Micrarchaeota archaeon]
MKKIVLVLVVLGLVVASFAAFKLSQGLQPQSGALFSSEVSLEKGQAVPAWFVSDQDGPVAGPCTAVCENGKTGSLWFSSLR